MQRYSSVRNPRLLFASWHCLVDPSSGAAISARELLTLLAQRGWETRVVCGPALDFDRGENVRQVLADQHLKFDEKNAIERGSRYSLLSYRDDNSPSVVFVPGDAQDRVPSLTSGRAFLQVIAQSWGEWKPDILLTYGGYWLAEPLLRLARDRGMCTAFWLRNFAYKEARLFNQVDCTIVPSHCSANHYRSTLGISVTILPSPLDWQRVQCEPSALNRFVTFVNPQPHKGVFVFARIAEQLYRRRPDIPLLIVEGRSGVEWLERVGIDLSDLTNLHVMRNTPDPRDFYKVTRVLLMPSLWRESFGRVAAEAMINGIPVLAASRGSLPELLEGAGFLFDVPDQYTPEARIAPEPHEVACWLETIIRLWDDQAFYMQASERANRRAAAWRPDSLARAYDSVFREVIGLNGARRPEDPAGQPDANRLSREDLLHTGVGKR